MKTKLFVGVLAFTVTCVVVPNASAQQRNTMTTTNGNHTTTTPPNPNAVKLPYPVSAARYEQFVSARLTMLRNARPIGPLSQGDINKVILLVRDCAMRVEADGVVTHNEMRQCNAIINTFTKERVREIKASSTAEDWARWAAQSPHPH